MQRRTFFGWVGAGLAAATVGVPVRAEAATQVAPQPSALSEEAATLEGLLGRLTTRPVGAGYRVSSVSRVERGAVTLLLSRGAETALVRVFRRSATSSGLASSRLFDLRLMNGADGVEGTHEHVGVAVMTLAARLARLERGDLQSLARAARVALATHDEYLRVHGGSNPTSMA